MAFDAAIYQCLRIIRLLLTIQNFNHFLITDPFNIPAQQDIGQPDQRIKPMNGLQQKAQGLDNKGFFANSSPFPFIRFHPCLCFP